MKKLLSNTRRIFLLALAWLLSSFNSQEHKVLADIGFSRVIIPESLRPLLNRAGMQVIHNYQNFYVIAWQKAKLLAVGFDNNDSSQYRSDVICQDNCYFTGYGQLEGNKKNWIDTNTNRLPDDYLTFKTYIGNSPEYFSFGDLVALYGDFRRTVYAQNGNCYLTSPDNININFSGNNVGINHCPDKMSTTDYLKKIALGVWPPYGSLGNVTGPNKGETQYDDAAWWGDEMMRLANVNETHFSNVAVAWYLGMHRLALIYMDKAIDDPAYLMQALHYEASALHCLTDLFCCGHVVTSRDESSYGTMQQDGLLNSTPFLWMENVIRMAGGSRNADGKGKIMLSPQLPAVHDTANVKLDFMPSYFSKNPLKSFAAWAKQEHDYHDHFNAQGAIVRNFNGDRFQIYGDMKLHDLDSASRRIIEDAVTASVQELLNSYDLLSANRGRMNEIGAAGSSFFNALKFIPVFIETDPDNYFTGMWTTYAAYVQSIAGIDILSPVNKNCVVPVLSGERSLINKWPTVQPHACSAFPADIVPTVRIGNQVWMKRNLDVSTYRDGTVIPEITDQDTWDNLNTGAWCHYNNDPANERVYGKLYNWAAINDPRGLAPPGWHLPTDSEWTVLKETIALTNPNNEGGAMKTNFLWAAPNTGATNNSFFSALPGGMRTFHCSEECFRALTTDCNWWSATEDRSVPAQPYNRAWVYYIFYNMNGLYRNTLDKRYGFSVRCVKD